MRRLTPLVLLVAVGGCAQILGLEAGHLADGGVVADGQTGDGGAGSDAEADDGAVPDGGEPDGGVGCISWCGSTTACGTCLNTPTVALDKYRIDATEVKVADYQAWLAVRPGLGGFDQVALCNWIANDFVPANWEAQTATPDLPVTGVNWCQAQGFCFWSKKWLCGRIGLNGHFGGAPFDNYDKLGLNGSEWYNACTGGHAGQAYPNAGAGTAGVCNVESTTLRSVNDGAACYGGFTGIFDMSGNVAEWEDSCATTDGRDDLCHIRGGSYATLVADATCDLNLAVRRDTQSPQVGFRCCADL
jgi:hypothetical protein